MNEHGRWNPEWFTDYPLIRRAIEAHPNAPSVALAGIWEFEKPEEIGRFVSELSKLFSTSDDEQTAKNPQLAATLECGYWLGNETDPALRARWRDAVEGIRHPILGPIIFLDCD